MIPHPLTPLVLWFFFFVALPLSLYSSRSSSSRTHSDCRSPKTTEGRGRGGEQNGRARLQAGRPPGRLGVVVAVRNGGGGGGPRGEGRRPAHELRVRSPQTAKTFYVNWNMLPKFSCDWYVLVRWYEWYRNQPRNSGCICWYHKWDYSVSKSA